MPPLTAARMPDASGDQWDRRRLGRQARTLTTVARVTVTAALGGEERRAIDLSAVAAWIGGWLARQVVGEVIVATSLSRHHPHRGCQPVTVPAEVAGVETAPEGEVNHRRDGRDDADKGTHGWPL